MSLPKPTIVIFDMDGTTVRHLNPRLLGLMERLDDMVFKVSRLWSWIFERKAQGPLLLEKPDEPVKPPKSIIVHKAIHKLRRKPVELLVEPCPGIFSVLSLLKSHTIPMALVSNGLGKGYGEDIVKKFGLNAFFHVTIFREDIRKSKPSPEPILQALGHLKDALSADDVVWYVGDRHKDVTAVKNAEPLLPCPIIPLSYGLNAAAALIEKGYGSGHILMTYQDMHDMLSELFEKQAEKPRHPGGDAQASLKHPGSICERQSRSSDDRNHSIRKGS
ncbi:MAG: HAD hydrolase-like protein [Rhodospirillales bacterium]|nr:HAD hydrolase-like protein [Rhodospirillales bacterium]